MADILSLSVKDFVGATASKQPIPGGGSVAALCGALAASLAAMALQYTVGKKAFAAHDAEIRTALAQFQNASSMLQELMVEDIAAYQSLSELLKIPEVERLKNAKFVPAVAAAIRVPQATAGFAMNILERCAVMLDKTNKMLISDLGIAAVYAHATVHASELNVRINLPLLPDKEEAQSISRQMMDLTVKADRIYAAFRSALLERM